MPGLRMWLQQGAWLAWIFAAGVAGFLWESLQLSPVASLIPRIVLSATLLLLLLEIGVELKTNAARAARASGIPADSGSSSDVPPGTAQPWRIVLWVAGLPLAIWVAGLVAGSALFCCAFLRFRSRESWRFSLAVAVCLALVLQLLFSWAFQSVLYRGLWTH